MSVCATVNAGEKSTLSTFSVNCCSREEAIERKSKKISVKVIKSFECLHQPSSSAGAGDLHADKHTRKRKKEPFRSQQFNDEILHEVGETVKM